MYAHSYVCVCVYVTASPFTLLLGKYWSDQLQFFVGALGTLGQHEFAFGFRSSIRSFAVGDPCSSSTFVYNCQNINQFNSQ